MKPVLSSQEELPKESGVFRWKVGNPCTYSFFHRDLYGAVGTPTKVAKTVVVGEIHEVVSTIISILSYFIRCSTVKEVVKVPSDFSPQVCEFKMYKCRERRKKREIVFADYAWTYLSLRAEQIEIYQNSSWLCDCALVCLISNVSLRAGSPPNFSLLSTSQNLLHSDLVKKIRF